MNDYFSAKESHSKVFLPITYVHKYTPPVKHEDNSGSPDSMPELIEESESDKYFEDAPESQATNLPSASHNPDQQDVFHGCHGDPNSPTL